MSFMKTCFVWLFVAFLCACSGQDIKKNGFEGLKIYEVEPDRNTALVKQHLQHLAQIHDLRAVLFSKTILVKTGPLDHYSNIVTINTEFSETPYKLFAAWLHQEFHFWQRQEEAKVEAFIPSLHSYYPQFGKMQVQHLLIYFLEYESLRHYLGEVKAKALWQELLLEKKEEKWYFEQILARYETFKELLEKHSLLPNF
jgi:hypothetical protein